MLDVELNMFVLCLRVNIRVYISCIKYNQTSYNAKYTYLPKMLKLHSKRGVGRVMSPGELAAADNSGNAKFKPLVSVRGYLGLGGHILTCNTQAQQVHSAVLPLENPSG